MIQIQPMLDHLVEYLSFCGKYMSSFEVMEFSLPNRLDDDKWRQEAIASYRKTGKAASLHGAFIDVNPASGDAEIRKASLFRIEESCRIAAAIGAKNVVFHTSAHPFLNGTYLTNWARKSAECYNTVSDRYGIRIFIENSQDTYPDALCELMRYTDSGIGVCLDIGHANYSRTPVEEWFRALGSHIGYIHISDNKGRFDDHLPAGRGTIDWKHMDTLWKNIGSPELITLEMNTLSDTAETMAYLKENRLFGLMP